MPFKRILCAVDFSEGSVEAFRIAVELARLHCGSLHVFHVIEAQPVAPSETEIKILQEANQALERLVASARPSPDGWSITSEVTSGRAVSEIVNRARDWRAELIVLGAKGTPSLAELILGGTAEGVTHQAPCSVLVVRAAHQPDRS